MRLLRFAALAVLATAAAGCVTIAGNRLKDLEPARAAVVPRVEHTIGEFSFHLDGGKMITSIKAGRELNAAILGNWKKKGWISGETYVKDGHFTGTADYEITLAGFQNGESSIFLQLISGFSLVVIPYFVDTYYKVVYEVRERATGRTWSVEVRDSYNTIVSLLLLPATPFSLGGATKTFDRIAAHLYEELKKQGAFEPAPAAGVAAGLPTVSN